MADENTEPVDESAPEAEAETESPEEDKPSEE